MVLNSCPLGTYRTLIVATDGSEASKKAVEVAFELAKTCKSFLYIVSVIEIYPMVDGAIGMVDKLKCDIQAALQPLKQRAEDENIPCEISVLTSQRPDETIVDLAKQKSADAIIIGTHGRTGIKKVLLGSVSRRVIGDAPCPIWQVPPKVTFDIQSILVATDGSVNGNLALEDAFEASQACSTDLTVVSVVKPDGPAAYRVEAEKIVEQAKKEGASRGIPVEGIVAEGEPWKKIVEIAKDKSIGVIMIGRHGHSALDKLLLGSVTERVAGHAPCSVIVVPLA